MSELEDFNELFEPPEDKVDALKRAAEIYFEAESRKRAADEAARGAAAALKNTNIALVAAMDAAGLKSFRLASGALLTKVVRKHYKMPPAQDEDRCLDALGWLRANGMGHLLKPYVNPQTLGATLREWLDQPLPADAPPREVPASTFGIYEEVGISARKA